MLIRMLTACTLAGSLISVASASVIGELDLSSGANSVTVSSNSIVWNGPFTTSSSSTLTYDGGTLVPAGTSGDLLDLSTLTIFPLAGFISFPSIPNLVFNATAIGPGSANTNCASLSVGDSCSVFAGSPIILTETASGTTASLTVIGNASDGIDPATAFTGEFTEPITGRSPADIQKQFQDPTATITTPYSGTFALTSGVTQSSVPEPATGSLLALAGGVFVGLGLIRRNRNPRP